MKGRWSGCGDWPLMQNVYVKPPAGGFVVMERDEWVKAAVRHTPREAKDNLKSTQLLSVIDAISEGPVEGPVDGLKSVLLNSTPVLDSEGNTNISGVTVVFRAGEQERHRRRDLNPPAPRRCSVQK
ncbi:hypothetical protein BANRA_04753 [Escherichia coli]|nr:hypothetical protein BANRA_04753 [Escherichia coli]